MVDYKFNNTFKNPDAIVSISDGDKVSLKGVIVDDFTHSGGNQWNSPYESQAQESLGDMANKAVGTINAVTGSSISNFQLKFLSQTTAGWTGSNIPEFQINTVFVATDPTYDVRAKVAPMFSAVYPTIEGGVIAAPLGYQAPVGDATPKGTFTVSIGRWFKAPLQIITSFSVNFSKETISSGFPLKAEASIGFRPYRMIDAATAKSYIKQ